MTTGVPIYLVSACASGEEFISAFRRYADRNGVVFVPIAQPLAPGRKGRFALTLKDGGVMVEGVAEVVSSARTPSVLYGRVGMTLKFTEPDEPSKTTLGELEKARLAMKPAPPSIAARPAEVPAEPRPTPPAPGGRVDAVNALAECVVIGDLSTLSSDDIPPRMGNLKFVVPSIPPAPGRPKAASVPPPTPPTRPPTGQNPTVPKSPTGQTPIVSRPPTGQTPIVSRSPTGQTPIVARPPTGQTPIVAAPRPPTPAGAVPVVGKETVMGMVALGRPPADAPAAREDATMPTPASVAAAAATSPRDRNELAQTVRGPAPGVDLLAQRGPAAPMPVVARPPTPTPPLPLPIAPPPPIIAPAPPIARHVEAADEPTDLTEMPQVDDSIPIAVPSWGQGSGQGQGQGQNERQEKKPRKTVIGIAVVPSGVHVLPAAPPRRPNEDELRDTSVMTAQDEASGPVRITSSRPTEVGVDALGATQVAGKKFPSGLLNAPTVEEPTPSGDWTMTPGEHGPTIARRVPAKPAAAVPVEDEAPIKSIPAGPSTGDWMIALDPSQPDGWSEPSKIGKPPPGEPPGPPVSTVSSDKDLDSNAKLAPEPKGPVEPKVEIDPTLMEPLQPMQAIDDFDDEPQLPPPLSAVHPAQQGMEMAAPLPPTPVPAMAMPMSTQGPLPGSYVTPVPGTLANASAQVPAFSIDPRGVTDAGSGFFRDTNETPKYPTDSRPSIERPADARRRRMIVIGISAAVALLLVIVLVVVAGGGSKKTEDDGSGSSSSSSATSDHVVAPPKASIDGGSTVQSAAHPTNPDSGQIAVAPGPDAAVEVPVAVDAAPSLAAKTDCQVDVSSAPQGAEIVLGKDVIGTTPTKITLPCGVESRLTLRKTRFVATQRAITPKPEGQKPLRVALGKVMFTVKVSSSPPGANIYLGSKSLGITPTAIKLPAFELSTLKIAKDGYAPDLQKITPKTNNLSISSLLKKAPKPGR